MYGVNGTQLWKSQGAEESTIRLSTIEANYSGWTGTEPPTRRFRALISVDGVLYAFVQNGAVSELWKSDGSIAGTERINAAVEASDNIGDLLHIAIDDDLIYYLDDVVSDGTIQYQLWQSDGTSIGTRFIAELPQAYIDGECINCSDQFLVHQSKLYINYNTSPIGSLRALTAYDPSNNIFENILLGIGNLVYADDLFYFSTANDLWKSDGSILGKEKVYSFDYSYVLSRFIDIKEELYFTAKSDFSTETELWRSNGTSQGTKKVLSSDSFNGFATLGGSAYFTISPVIGKTELWKIDGSSKEAVLVSELSTWKQDVTTILSG